MAELPRLDQASPPIYPVIVVSQSLIRDLWCHTLRFLNLKKKKLYYTEFSKKSTSDLRLLSFGQIDNVDIFERYDTNGAMEVFYLGTDPRYQGRGIGRRMMQECIGFGRGLLNGTRRRTSIDGVILEQSVIPSIIFGVFASNYSQRIADKLGFHVLHEVRYDDYASNGRKMSERIGSVHKTARLQVLKL